MKGKVWKFQFFLDCVYDSLVCIWLLVRNVIFKEFCRSKNAVAVVKMQCSTRMITGKVFYCYYLNSAVKPTLSWLIVTHNNNFTNIPVPVIMKLWIIISQMFDKVYYVIAYFSKNLKRKMTHRLKRGRKFKYNYNLYIYHPNPVIGKLTDFKWKRFK